MISLLHDSEQAACNAVAKAHAEYTDQCIMEALFTKFGFIPPLDEIAAHCVCVYDPDNVAHYLWFDGAKPKIGEKVDLEQAFCVIEPPDIFHPEKPETLN